MLSTLDWFQLACLIVAAVMLVWDTIEVGRNDAANLVNAVFGARIMARRTAICIAGAAVVCGAVLSSDVIDTARKGIFSPTALGTGSSGLEKALAIYIAVYIVDTCLLYSYSAFGMPVSTTACLVFELLGAAIAIQASSVNWGSAGRVISGIICSIILTGIIAFMIQRAVRGAIRDRTSHLSTLLLHGGWIGGGLAAGLFYFLLLKGMKNVGLVKQIKEWLDNSGEAAGLIAFVVLWGGIAIVIHGLLVVYRQRFARVLFPGLAICGMIAMAFAFGQNDLANCAAPGLAAFTLLQSQDVQAATEVPIPAWALLICGLLMFAGMTTRNAERVTKASVSTGSMGDRVALWAPRWCIRLASQLLRFRGETPALAPRAAITPAGKTVHYDTLRACVIMSVSAGVIATASSLALPVSTTYVSFAAVIATGMADRIFQRGDAELKLGRAIWVVFSWGMSAVIAAVCAGLVALLLLHVKIGGIVIGITANLLIRRWMKRRADAQNERVAQAVYERTHPEAFALEDE